MNPPLRNRESRTRPIVRVRTGCLRCRARKKKCDERKPTCRACERNEFQCEWPTNVTQTIRRPSIRIEPREPNQHEVVHKDLDSGFGQEGRGIYSGPSYEQTAGGLDGAVLDGGFTSRSPILEHDDTLNFMPSPVPASLASSHPSSRSSSSAHQSDYSHMHDDSSNNGLQSESPPVQFTAEDGTHFQGQNEEQGNNHSAAGRDADMVILPWEASDDRDNMRQSLLLPRTMSLLPDYGHDAFELLSHYIAKTAESMANGFSPSNPFLSQLIPLAFSSDIVFRLILSQSAAHRALLQQAQIDEFADRHYSKSVKLFRKRIDNHIGGKETNPLMLAVGALIMCFTETAKGDINGVIFDHLSASTPLLLIALRQRSLVIPKELKEFLVEYYSYTATLSMISIDTSVSSQSLLNPELEELAYQLVVSRYIGSLCGCWMELLLIIPQVFNLGRQWRLCDQAEGHESATSSLRSSFNENVALFASLQSRILKWSPHSCDTNDGTLAGRIFQQALLLYLYTSLDNAGQNIGPNYESLIETAVAESMLLFDQLSPTVRINTSLCWPIAVIGSCIRHDTWRQKIRNRLNNMFATIGLGNIKQTLQVLEYLWKRQSNDAGPWSICRVMQDHQIWISFA